MFGYNGRVLRVDLTERRIPTEPLDEAVVRDYAGGVGVAARMMKFNYLKLCGVLSGSMTDPPALEFANSQAPGPAQSTSYATVYPLTMFLRVFLAQILILLTL